MANAICILTGHFNIFGVVFFKTDVTDCVIVKGEFTGLPPGKHGLHIHSFGDLTNDWISAGPHYNPDNEIHGAPEENNRHAGDLGNVEVNEDGLAKLDMEVQHFHLTGIHSIIGRSLVIHQNEDDLGKGDNEESLTTGNTGEGLAWGVIGICQGDILEEVLKDKSN
ncbi:superoxide dismutase [Cu-Zn]-like [Rhincodon typus]|uniref:superoxide dismutase [Cu-Zn]-like n=1 Tax=Rhincodon typus TaxID=259920 RepID=UPI0009A3E147|nr:superoxide dismutase [Cu-Zn]-like [Rhincodon typus]